MPKRTGKPAKPKKRVVSFRLSEAGIAIAEKLAQSMGVGRSAVIETAIRRMGEGAASL